MSAHAILTRTLQRYPALGAFAYAAVLLGCVTASWLSVAHVLDQRASLATAQDFLSQLQHRWPAARHDRRASDAPPGSPFIAGRTVTVAGSKLLQRVSRAIARVGGRILSSQVDLDAARRTPGFISVLVNCQLDQPGLQKVLYNLEAGMPFVFIDRLEVHMLEGSAHARLARLHVLLSVSGQWRAKQ